MKPGRYAIAVCHDLSGNGRLDRNVIGFPTEPPGFSHDVGRIARPSFESAPIPVSEPSTIVGIPVR